MLFFFFLNIVLSLPCVNICVIFVALMNSHNHDVNNPRVTLSPEPRGDGDRQSPGLSFRSTKTQSLLTLSFIVVLFFVCFCLSSNLFCLHNLQKAHSGVLHYNHLYVIYGEGRFFFPIALSFIML